MRRHFGIGAAALVCLAGMAAGALGQDEPRPDIAPLVQRLMRVDVDSGVVRARPGDENTGQVVFALDVHAPRSTWLRLMFDKVVLAGDPASGNASYVRITSYLDGASQRLNAEQLEQWANTSAYFNGDVVRVELVAFPGTGDNRLVMSRLWASDEGAIPEDICGGVDDRVQSFDARNARYMSTGCTAWMFNDLNRQFSMAGHCGASASGVVQFNVPLSNPNGSVNHPPPEDQYSVEATSIQSQNGGIGADWAYFGVNPNTNTGQQPFQKQGGVSYVLNASSPASVSSPPQTIRITGYGTSTAVPTLSQVQKTHTGPLNIVNATSLRYIVDTTGGNSGSPVLVDSGGGAFNQTVVGVHTHAGCSSGGNQGTRADQANYRAAILNPRGVCASGRFPVSGTVYAIGDWANNLGTVNTTNGQFGKIAQVGVRWEGMAWEPVNGFFFAVNANRQLFRVSPAGSATLVGTLSGALVINGLAYDPASGTLFGIAQSNGQLVRINTTTAAVTNIGAASGGLVGALEWHPGLGRLFGLDDSGGATRLVEFNPATGARTVIGNLGAGATDCNGLAYNHADGLLYSIQNLTNTATVSDAALRINPATGAATSNGATGGFFGAGFGMAGTYPVPCCAGDWNCDGVIDFNDFLAYLNDYNAGAQRADLNGDGVVDFNDLLEFLNRYNAPCP